MRRIVVLLTLGVMGLAPAVAQAIVTPNKDPVQVGTSLSTPAASATGSGSSFTAIPPEGNPVAVADSALSDFPRDGSTFAILSSGDAKKADPANSPIDDSDGGEPDPQSSRPSVYDLTTLRLDRNIPAGVNCLVFTFRFFTDEDPGDASFNDGFLAELDASDWTAPGGQISAPRNFAFDAGANVISVNSSGSTSLSAAQATGTGYKVGTTRLTAATPVAPGSHSIFLSIFDQGDDGFDSAVFVDQLDFQNRPAGDCTRGAQAQIVTPVRGQSVGASVVSGIVRIRGRDGKFRRLRGDEAIPLGTLVDARRGKVRITSIGPGGKLQSALFYQGMFVVTQTRGSKPITQLALAEKLRCGASGKASQSARRKVRRLWGDGKGSFRTKGRRAAATVRGTKWLTEDRCNGTLVRVRRGSVTVRDFVKRKTVIVRKGKSYFARARR